ncbi:hypothetical protein HOH45_09410 [bacterium]|nr:hypothetical protein [bacterium]
MLNQILSKVMVRLSSLKITVVCLFSLFVLVFVGTLAQVSYGIYQTQQRFFLSAFVWLDTGFGFSIPILPGAELIGSIMIINLSAVIWTKNLLSVKKLGLGLMHVGMIFLLVGAWITSAAGIESQMAIKEGQTASYSESSRVNELVFEASLNDTQNKEYVISQQYLEKNTFVEDTQLPFTIKLLNVWPNAWLRRASDLENSQVKGLGQSISVAPKPLATQDNELNFFTVKIEILNKEGGSEGVWIVSRGLGAKQTVIIDDLSYDMSIRSERYHYPFSITLKDFTHDVYPGTQIPKNFSSLVELNDSETGETRDVLVYMNHPLRYRGHTFFQASYGENNTLSVLQVVKNPGWRIPYIACLMISFGLCFHFLVKLAAFSNKQRKREKGLS